MRVRPLFYFYLIVILIMAFDATMWYRHKQMNDLSRRLKVATQQMESMYQNNQISPLMRSLRINANSIHETIKYHAKPWPIPDEFWNQLILKTVFWFILPILMIYLLYLHFRGNRSKPPQDTGKE
jgi:hypothetical protein